MILNGVSLQADPGMCVGILGSNGCGKSTLLQILAGEIPADAGHFYVDGTDLLHASHLKNGRAEDEKRISSKNSLHVSRLKGGSAADSEEAASGSRSRARMTKSDLIGYAPQGTPLIAELSALDNLRLWYDRPLLRDSLADGPLALLGIPEFLKTPVRKMSGGMKKRLAIGCAIAGNPKILLLDEPGAALDLLCKEAMENYFTVFLRRGGIIFLVTHDVQELRLCTHSCILKNGTLTPYRFDGDVRKLTEALRP